MARPNPSWCVNGQALPNPQTAKFCPTKKAQDQVTESHQFSTHLGKPTPRPKKLHKLVSVLSYFSPEQRQPPSCASSSKSLCESALLYDFVVLLGSQLSAHRPLRAITLTVGIPVFPHKALGTFNIVSLGAICRTTMSLDSPELPGRIVGKGLDRAPQPGQGDEG